MHIFLTSSPLSGGIPQPGQPSRLNPANDFIENLKAVWPKSPAHCTLAASDPENIGMTEGMAAGFAEALQNAGLPVAFMRTLDKRTEAKTEKILADTEVLILGGGHVPTQNAFFKALALKDKLQAFDGIVIGISAGSMNAVSQVYAVPELPGEAADPHYIRFMEGLGLADLTLVPHYGMIKDEMLDGKKIVEEIILPDSLGKTFYLLPDGSYFYLTDGVVRLFGPGFRAENGGFSII